MRYGLARGMYANEAATARRQWPTAPRAVVAGGQGLNAVMEVFIVSFVTSTISAMVVLLGAWDAVQQSRDARCRRPARARPPWRHSFNQVVPSVGGWVVAFCVFLFGYTTFIGWAFYGEQFLEYFFGPRVVTPYGWIYCLLIPLGAISKVDLVGVGRPDERAADLPEHHRRARPERVWSRRSRDDRRPDPSAASMFRVDLLKPDGRALSLYARQPIPAGLVAPSPSAQAVSPNSHLRWHPLRGEWVAYARTGSIGRSCRRPSTIRSRRDDDPRRRPKCRPGRGTSPCSRICFRR